MPGSRWVAMARFKTAFHYPERFCAAASFSGVLSLEILNLDPDLHRKEEFALLFGDLTKLFGSAHDPAGLVQAGCPGSG